MFALISPNEPRDGGVRVAELAENTFEVALPLYWVECDNTITTEHAYTVEGTFVLPTPVVVPLDTPST